MCEGEGQWVCECKEDKQCAVQSVYDVAEESGRFQL